MAFEHAAEDQVPHRAVREPRELDQHDGPRRFVLAEVGEAAARVDVEDDDRNPEALGNQVQLQQVILNLVMNAIESMSSLQTRLLRIKTELSQSSTVHVSVEDTGTGIKPSDVTLLFQPMFTTKTRGMGMGLSICKSIIEDHDGRIWVSPGQTAARFSSLNCRR